MALHASAFIMVVACCRALVEEAAVSAQARAGGAQSTGDPCRFATAEAVGKAFGRPMQSSKLVDVCQYRGTPNGLVVVRVKAGPEGTILQHARSAAAQEQKIAEKIRLLSGGVAYAVGTPRVASPRWTGNAYLTPWIRNSSTAFKSGRPV